MGSSKDGKNGHYILPDGLALKTFGGLIVLTFITVWIAKFDFGVMNFPIAMFVASIKAFLVAWIFMNLAKDSSENRFIFVSSVLFLAIFVGLTASDIFFRGDVYVKGAILPEVAGAPSKFKKAWEPTPELVAHGKGLFEAQCTACHGANGGGDGPAASALNPKPRNFHLADGWKNGRKPSQIFKTLKEGIAGGAMASFAGVPEADRWAMSHYVATLGPDLLKDSETDLAAVGVDPNKAEVVAEEKPTLPVEMALEIMAEPDKGRGHLVEGTVSDVETNAMENYSRRLDQSLQKRRY